MNYLNLFAIILLFVNSNAYKDGGTLNKNSNKIATIFANSTYFQAITATNSTQVYDQLLAKFSNYCLSERDFELLYGNKSKFRIVVLFGLPLIHTAYNKIGQNELRRCLHLKPLKITLFELVEEEPEDLNFLPHFKKYQEYFQRKVYSLNKFFYDHFWPADIDTAEKFLNQKFPEIQQLFQLKYQEESKDHCLEAFNEHTIEKLFELFVKTRNQLLDLTRKMINQSVGGLSFDKNSKCYKSVS